MAGACSSSKESPTEAASASLPLDLSPGNIETQPPGGETSWDLEHYNDQGNTTEQEEPCDDGYLDELDDCEVMVFEEMYGTGLYGNGFYSVGC